MCFLYFGDLNLLYFSFLKTWQAFRLFSIILLSSLFLNQRTLHLFALIEILENVKAQLSTSYDLFHLSCLLTQQLPRFLVSLELFLNLNVASTIVLYLTCDAGITLTTWFLLYNMHKYTYTHKHTLLVTLISSSIDTIESFRDPAFECCRDAIKMLLAFDCPDIHSKVLLVILV